MDINSLNSQYKILLSNLNNVDPEIKLNIANSIWLRDTFKPHSNYIDVNKDTFGAEVSSIDFSKSDAVDTINNWISDATNGKINNMISPPIKSNTVMYLINAIYFKGGWTWQFNEKLTKTANFTKESGEVNKVNMMNYDNYFKYGKGSDYSAIKLPYGAIKMPYNGDEGKKINMYCILPDSGVKIDDFISKLDTEKFNSIKESIKDKTHVDIYLPRFKMEYERKLNDDLKVLGMKDAFANGAADLAGIAEGLYVDEAAHKAVVEVNEKGTEAAAVTYLALNVSMRIETIIKFELNRPFVFAIIDDNTGSILFIGKAADLAMDS
jgi:serpin B